MNFLPCNNFGLTLRVLCVGFVSLGTSVVYPENDSRKGFSSTILEIQNRGSSNVFHGISPDKTGVKFVSQVDEWEASQNRVLYNGAGVAVGDYDRDGWPDIFICSVDGNSVLYKNDGDWAFVDTTVNAGLGKMGYRHRGAVFADLNGDSWLDLLVGTVGMGIRTFINHEGVFEETTEKSGVMGRYAPMTMALADIDGNGTVDLYVTNNRSTDIRDEGSVKLRRVKGKLVIPPEHHNRLVVSGGVLKEYGEPDILFINDGNAVFRKSSWLDGTFLNSDGKPLEKTPLDWGLAAAFHDINDDGLPDLYVCNDFWSPDRFWINEGGVFKFVGPQNLSKTSASSMGVDFSDYDRDGDVDLFVVDMLSRDLAMQKRQMVAQDETDRQMTRGEFGEQVMRNTLLNNRGDGSFAELAHFAGLPASDWSWSPIFMDVDLDGYEDLIITAGHYKDTQDMDVNALIQTRQKPRDRSLSPAQRKTQFGKEMMANNRLYPNLNLPIVTFRNGGNGVFQEKTSEWGTNENGIHHGIAAADFDLDGDMDLIVNNMNKNPGVYENRFMAPRVAVVLHGDSPNTEGVGSKIYLSKDEIFEQSKEVVVGGRFLSGSETRVVFGVGSKKGRMSLTVRWRSGKTSIIKQVKENHLYHIYESGSSDTLNNKKKLTASSPLFRDISERINYNHVENAFDDFQKQPLLPFKLSQQGPALLVGDINSDYWDDLIVGCSKGGRINVFVNEQNGNFKRLLAPQVAQDDVASIFSIGSRNKNEFVTVNCGYEGERVALTRHRLVKDQILSDSVIDIPIKSVGAVAQADVDGDGDLDLFFGAGPYPGRYPEASRSAIYLFDGAQYLQDNSNAKILLGLGIVHGAVWYDFDSDGYPELITAGHWQPVRFFKNEKGVLRDASREMGLMESTGIWNSIQLGDVNGDGKMDLIAGNWGLNSPYKTKANKPLALVFGDLNEDGTNEIIESEYYEGNLVPVRPFNDFAETMPYLYSRFKSFRQFSRATVAQVIGDSQGNARMLSAQILDSCIFINQTNKFKIVKLPDAAQWAPTHGIVVGDFNGDSFEDLFLAQNFYPVRSGVDKLDASRGVFCRGNGTEQLEAIESKETGLILEGDQRAVATGDFNRDGRSDLVVTQNNGQIKLYLNNAEDAGLRVVVKGKLSNPDGFGSVLRIKYNDGMGPARSISGASGYRSQGSPVQLFGLKRIIESVLVQKPDSGILKQDVKKGTKELVIHL